MWLPEALLVAALASAPSAEGGAASADKLKVAVMDLEASSKIDVDLKDALTSAVVQELDALGPFKAISSADIKKMVEFEAEKQSLGCEEGMSCLAEIGSALGADYLVAGNVRRIDDAFLVEMQLLNIGSGRPMARVSREVKGTAKALLDDVRTATKILVRDLLVDRSGTLRVDASEEGATIRLDGTIVGASPMPALQLSGGVHTLVVEKEGFIAFTRDVEVLAKQETVVDARLIPSPEYRRAYTARATWTRVAALSSGGAGLLALVGAGAAWGVGEVMAGDLRRDVEAYNASALRGEDDLRALDRRESDLALIDAATLSLAAIGAAATTAGVVLFFTGEDPGRYAEVADQE